MDSETQNKEDQIVLNKADILIPLSIILGALIIAFSIIYGLSRLDVSIGTSDNAQEVAGLDSGQEVTVSVDDDPIIGSLNDAEKVIVEFSDYQCPFCERFFSGTLPDIKKEFIDTGKAALVFRDLPLSIHEPTASQKAVLAECVRKQTSDEGYFSFHNTLFENINNKDASPIIAKAVEMGVDENELKACSESQDVKEEVKKDVADATALGINGTPGFIIGTYDKDSKTVKGTFISGAQPFEVFKQAIES